MGQKQRISRIMIAAIAGILVLYAFMQVSLHPVKKVQDGINRFLMEKSEETYLTGFAYLEGGKEASFSEWVTESAMKLVPLGTYVEGKASVHADVEDEETYAMILAQQANDENAVDENGQLVGGDDKEEEVAQTSGDGDLLNAENLMGKNLKIDQASGGPKVLIYHTHSQEAFADSTEGDASTTIMGMGAYLSDLLNNTYGIETLHHEGVYDLVDGKLDRSMAYQLAEPQIQNILAENPSIEVVIDLHRDGVAEGTHLVTEINGRPTAQIMFFNGLSRTKANGNISYLANPYIEDNLAFSLQMQIAAANKYPGFTRHIYLRAYRYNMHLKPKTLLIEAGAQTNTVEEMRNAMEVLADTLDHVLTK